MQLSDVLELAARHGAERYAKKRAGILLPMAVGAMIPGIVHKAIERKRSTERMLDRSAYDPMKLAALPPWLTGAASQARANPMGAAQSAARGMGGAAKALGLGQILGAPGAGIGHGLSSMIERKVFGDPLGQRQDAMGIAGASAAKSFGAEAGKAGIGLLRDIANKAMEAAGHAGDASAREAIIGDLKKTDSVLANADDQTLMEAYHTMTRFAPVLSTDKNAVRSFLRQAVMSGAGPDYMSIKLLADSERAVTGGKESR